MSNIFTCSPEKCHVVSQVRTRLAIEGYADVTDKCTVCRWLSAFKAWFNDSTVKEYED